MFILKLLGILFLITSTSILGIYFANRLNLRFKFLKQYMGFLTYVQSQVKYSAKCSKELIKTYKSSGEFARFLISTKENIENGFAFEAAFNIAIKKFKSVCGLQDSDIDVLRSFSANFGNADINAQILLCQELKNQLAFCLESAKEERIQKGKVYITLGISAGVSLTLFLM